MCDNKQDKKSKVFEEQRHVSSKISDLCRYIGFGIAAAAYAIFSSNSDFARNLLVCDKELLIFTAITAVLVIFTDYLQFLCGYMSVRTAIANKDDGYKYKPESLPYKGRFVFFITKQVLTGVSVILLLVVLVRNIA